MTYRVLAREYRPQRFDEVVGQEHITKTLTRSFENDRLGHAYIFSGPRGVGKTTTARLLAKLVNCSDPDNSEPCNECQSCAEIGESRSVDVMEIDGASNNSVDQIRDLRENVQYAPANNRRKIYIIDEVHMLSKSAFNALLKTLEEPPDHVIFIFATTEIEKVPDTILSRCQRFDFRLIPIRVIVDSLRTICRQEDIPAEDEALFLIARFAEGSLRDAQSILDQMINFTGAGEETLTEEKVSDTWGLAPFEELVQYLECIREKSTDDALNLLHDHVASGNDLTSLIADLTEMIRNLTLLQTESDPGFLETKVPDEILKKLQSISEYFTLTELDWTFDQLMKLHKQMRENSRFQLQLAEIGLVRIIRGRPKYNLSEIIDRLEDLETPTGDRSVQKNEISSATAEDTSPSPQSENEKDSKSLTTSGSPERNNQEKQQDPVAEGADADAELNTSDQALQKDSENPDSLISIVERTPHPAKAYLRERKKLRRKGDKLIIYFDRKWKNHAEKLKSEEHLQQISNAAQEVLDTTLQPVVEIKDPKPEEQVSDEESIGPQQEESEPPRSDEQPDQNRLLEQTLEVFDVERVEKIDDT